MRKHIRRSAALIAAAVLLALWPSPAAAQPAGAIPSGLSDEAQFVLSSFALLVWGALVMWMCAGFTMLESGSVRTKNAAMICLKNVGLYSIAGLAYFVLGYNLMHVGVGDLIGEFRFLVGPSEAESALMAGGGAVAGWLEVVGSDQSQLSFFFFQVMFVAAAASIVSGAIAERVKLWAFFLFVLLLTMFVYPIVGSWIWGGGWLGSAGFKDFAGATVVHGTGGWAALAGLIVIGPRLGKFRANGSVKATPPSNVLLVTLGVLILWLGWFGFNGGSQLALGSAADALSMSTVLVSTNLAGGAGLVAALCITRFFFGRMDLAVVLNGGLAGLVSITAAPVLDQVGWAIVIGAVGGCIAVMTTKLLEKARIDDVVGAVPVHLGGGIWGCLAASINGGADLEIQFIGMASVGAFVFLVSLILWKVMDLTFGLRVSPEIERIGQDVGELGIESRPEFVLTPDDLDDL